MTEKLDIFDTLKHIDQRDITFYDSLSPELKKSFAPVVFMRWFSGGTKLQTQLANGILNPMVFKMYNHPGLMYKLMVACSDGKQKRYAWVKKKSKDKSSPTAVKAIMQYYDCSHKGATRYKKLLSVEDILEIADVLGYDKDVTKKIKDELK